MVHAVGVVGAAVADPTQGDADARRSSLWASPPRFFFHTVLLSPVALLLYSLSYPGYYVEGALWLLALLAFACVWGARATTYVIARRSGRARRSPWWFLVAPVLAVIVVALAVFDVPLRVRFNDDRGEFQAIVDATPPAGSVDDWRNVEVPDVVGSYRIVNAARAGDAMIFYEATGAFFDDAGFAYLPHGPDPALERPGFEAPTFQHLVGDWYAWTASW